jgi:transposase
MAEFADMTGLVIQLVYYPPYHSKYNSIERFWAGLEKSWNGYLLDSVDTVLNRAASFAWKKTQPIVKLLDTAYEKGIKLCKKEKQAREYRLFRSAELPRWDIIIYPKMVYL